MAGNQAKKRNRDDEEQDDFFDQSPEKPKTPHVSPDNVAQGAGMAPINQLGNDQMDLETQMQEKSSGTPKALAASKTQTRPGSPVKRLRLQNETPSTNDTGSEDVQSNSWEVSFGLGWTAAESDGHEGNVFRDFTDIIAERFRLPAHVQWMAKNCNENLMLARISEGVCYFDSNLGRCWRLATTPLEAQKKCKEGLTAKEACEELVLCRYPGEPDSKMKLRPRNPDKPHIGSPPAEWFGVDYMCRLDGGRGICSQVPAPADNPDPHPLLASPSDPTPGFTTDETMTDESGEQHRESRSSDGFNPAEAMELD